MKSLSSLACLILYLVSCTPKVTPVTESASVNTDSLIQQWNQAWNAHDSASIMNLMNDAVILIGETNQVRGKDSIGRAFVGKNAPVLRDLKTRILTSGNSGNLAFVYGTYEHDVQLPDTLLKGIHGNFSLVYQHHNENWKLNVIQIEED